MVTRGCALLLLVALAACRPTPAGQAPPAAAVTATVAIVGVTVVRPALDGPAAQRAGQTVLIAGDRIADVGPAATTRVPAGARVIDGRGKWLIPGLIDAHAHFGLSGNPYARPDSVDYTRFVPYAEEVARNRARLPVTFQVYLASGVTSVVDPGGAMWNFEVRARAQAAAAAPRVMVAGPLLSRVARPELGLDDPPVVQVTTVADLLAAVRERLAHRPDFVKLWFLHREGWDLFEGKAFARVAAEVAHAAGIRYMVHATELEVAKAALRAGADILVHAIFDAPVDAELVALLRERDAIVISTLCVFAGFREVAAGRFQPTAEERRLADPEVLEALASPPRTNPYLEPADVPRVAMQNLVRLWEEGIPIALGTDAGNIGTVHGPSVFREARLLAAAGLTPAQVLRAATVHGARVLGMEDELADIAPGRIADLVLLDADPHTSVDHLARASLVLRAGVAHDPAELSEAIHAARAGGAPSAAGR